MSQLVNAIKHIKNGTFINAIKRKLDERKWNKFITGKQHVDFLFDGDIKLKLYTDSVLSRVIYQQSFEEEELAFYRKFIKPGFVVLDIGANIGLHVLYAAKLAGENGYVHAFEPVKKTFSRLQENIAINRVTNITAHNMAVSDTTGTAEINISTEGFDAWNSIAGQANAGHQFGRETIQTITLDEFCVKKMGTTKVDLIKIDTEGWEANVLKGGAKYLTENSPMLLVEYAQDILDNFGRTTGEIYDILTGYGYTLYKYNHNNNTMRKVSRDEKFGVANLIAYKGILI